MAASGKGASGEGDETMSLARVAMEKAGGARRIGRLLGAGALLGLLAACSSTPDTTVRTPPPVAQAPAPASPQQAAPAQMQPADNRIRVGLLLPLSGRGAAIGQSMLDAAQMALFDLGTDRFVLLPQDTAGTPDGAVQAARAVLDQGAHLILGPLFGPNAAAVKPVAAAAGRPVLSFSNDWTIAGGNLWVLGFSPHDQAGRVARYAIAQGYGRFGILAPTTPFGEAVVTSVSDTIQNSGGQIARLQRYAPDEPDKTAVVRAFSDFDQRRAALDQEKAALEARGDAASQAALRRLANVQTFGELPYQAVMIADGGQTLRELASLFPFFDVDPGPVKFLGTGLWDEPGLGREPALVGGWYAGSPPEARRPFEERFRSLFGRDPHRLATLAYDAVALAAVLARTGQDDTPYDPADLLNPNGFAGMDGIFRLLPNGQTQRGLAILEITRNGVVVVDPAPETFEPPVL